MQDLFTSDAVTYLIVKLGVLLLVLLLMFIANPHPAI
jgi:uncharacterized integral membrane protein